ncbi:MAG: helix-turn-helix domain-containing protein [Candidatus Paceibacterota bacterium]|jgi:DNA (cytosine-5)-methyltransferase 1
MDNRLITVKEAARILNVSKLTLRNWDNSGKLIAFRHPMNNYRMYYSEDIENIISKITSGEKPIRDTHIKKNKSWKIKVVHLD